MPIEIEELGLPIARAVKPFTSPYIVDEAIGALRVVRLSAADHVVIARPPEVEARAPIGIALTAAGSAGAEIVIRSTGELVDGSWGWTPGEPVFLGASGVLTQSIAAFPYLVVIGLAVAPNTIVINISPAYELAT